MVFQVFFWCNRTIIIYRISDTSLKQLGDPKNVRCFEFSSEFQYNKDNKVILSLIMLK